MQSALRDIFNGYKFDADPRPGRSCELNQSEASRLWYRCGLKLSCLTEILQSQSERTDKSVAFADFIGTVSEIVEEDEKWFAAAITPTEFQVGDRVELVEGYERFGDAVNGPLVPGERGLIVELQQGPEGERYVQFRCSDLTGHNIGYFGIPTELCFAFTSLFFQLISQTIDPCSSRLTAVVVPTSSYCVREIWSDRFSWCLVPQKNPPDARIRPKNTPIDCWGSGYHVVVERW